MKSIYSNRLGRALALLAALLEFSANAQQQFLIPTNGTPRGIPRRASIIFIQVDGLGYGDLSCYGQTNFQTPNLDKLAAGGIRFTNYSAAGTSSSSQAALMTGENSGQRHPNSHMDMLVTPDEINIAQILNNSGYHTGLIGEWYLGDQNSPVTPWREGFDEFAGYLNPADAENFYADYIWRLSPNVNYDQSYNDPISGHWREWSKANGKPTPGREIIYPNTQGKNEYIPDVLAKAALNFVKNNLPDQFNHWQPFFLLLNYKIPGDRIVVPSDAPFSEEPWPQPEKNKAALVSRIDGYVGELQEQLKNIGMTNNVAIFFSSGSVPEKTPEIDPDFFHSNISTNDFCVPMIVNWPGTIPAGQASGYKWSAQDFMPTAAQIAFAQSPTNIDGTSVLPELLGRIRK